MATPPPRTAVDIAAGVRGGSLSAAEVVEAVLEAIVQGDHRIDAWQVVRSAAARAEASAVDLMVEGSADAQLAALALAGVPIAVKDNVPVAGEPMRIGSSVTSDAPQEADHPVVARLRAAGAIVVGLTRVPELCVFGATDSSFGITRNPWNTGRTPGGSSGGSAAAVAAGMVPVAHGNDGMGSIRIPAACCGLVGIKPGHGVVPSGVGRNDWYGMAENGALATTVSDAALVLSVLADDPNLARVVEPEHGLRVGISTKPPVVGVRVDAEHREAVIRAGRLLKAAGHRVERADPPYPANPLPVLARWCGGASWDAEGLDRAGLDRAVRIHARLGDVARRRGLVKDGPQERFRERASRFFDELDVLVTPTLARPPIEAARWGERGWPRVFAANTRYAPFAAPWNYARYPAVTVPAGIHQHTMTPLSVQLVAPGGSERLLLGVALLLERLAPWPRTAPGFPVGSDGS